VTKVEHADSDVADVVELERGKLRAGGEYKRAAKEDDKLP